MESPAPKITEKLSNTIDSPTFFDSDLAYFICVSKWYLKPPPHD